MLEWNTFSALRSSLSVFLPLNSICDDNINNPLMIYTRQPILTGLLSCEKRMCVCSALKQPLDWRSNLVKQSYLSLVSDGKWNGLHLVWRWQNGAPPLRQQRKRWRPWSRRNWNEYQMRFYNGGLCHFPKHNSQTIIHTCPYISNSLFEQKIQ